MPLVVAPGYDNWTVTVQNTGGGASGQNSFSLGTQHTTPLGGTDVSRIANLFRDALTPLLDNGWLLGPVHVVTNVGGVLQVADDTGTEAGTASAAVYASPAVAHVVTKNTGLLGRSQRGRIYFPGVPEADVDEGGILAGARVNAVTAAFEDLRADLIADAAIDNVVLLHDSESPGDHTPTVIASMFCRTVVGTMRPRQRR